MDLRTKKSAFVICAESFHRGPVLLSAGSMAIHLYTYIPSLYVANRAAPESEVVSRSVHLWSLCTSSIVGSTNLAWETFLYKRACLLHEIPGILFVKYTIIQRAMVAANSKERTPDLPAEVSLS